MRLDPGAVARAVGGDLMGHNILAPGPGHSPADRSLSIKIDPAAPDGFLVHSFAGDPWMICREHVRAVLGLGARQGQPQQSSWRPSRPHVLASHGDAVSCSALALRDGNEAHQRVGTIVSDSSPSCIAAMGTTPCKYEREQHRKARWLWSQRQPIEGTPVERYLREVRAITCLLPSTLAYLPPTKPMHHPAMIGAFGMAAEVEPGVVGEPVNVGAVHLTFLLQDGNGKADASPDKITVGRPLGMPIMLAPPNDLLGLVVCEGIEDALSVHAATGLGSWAAGSAGFMPSVADVVPDYIETVTIFAHADQAGERGAHSMAEKLLERGVEVFTEGIAP